MLRDDPEPYLGAIPAVGELVRCTGARAASPRQSAIRRDPGAGGQVQIVSYYKELQWFTLAPIPSDTRHTAG